mgnify:CR=1 FL=1
MVPQLDLFNIVSSAAPDKKILVTKDNIVNLLPVLEPAQIYVALAGVQKNEQIPFDIPGLVALAGDDAMNGIYTNMTESMKQMTVTEDIFLALLATMNENDEDFKMLEESLYKMATDVDATYDSTLKKLGAAESASPVSINFYAKDFDSKAKIEEFIAEYNEPALKSNATDEEKAKKLSEELDLLEGLRLSVQHCEEVMQKNKDRYPILERANKFLVKSNIEIKDDIAALEAQLAEFETDEDEGSEE